MLKGKRPADAKRASLFIFYFVHQPGVLERAAFRQRKRKISQSGSASFVYKSISYESADRRSPLLKEVLSRSYFVQIKVARGGNSGEFQIWISHFPVSCMGQDETHANNSAIANDSLTYQEVPPKVASRTTQ